ncbi:MAG: undecaprenyl-phosphate glucose phosphotransferase [Oligoflexia bacterium]
MLKRYQSKVGSLVRISDAVCISSAWLLAYQVRFSTGWITTSKGIQPSSKYSSLVPLVIVLWAVVFSSQGLYGSNKVLRRTHEALLALKAHAMAWIVMLALTSLITEFKYSRSTLGIFGGLGALLIIGARITIRNAIRSLREFGVGAERTLIVGEGPSATMVAERIQKFPELGSHLVATLPGTFQGALPNLTQVIREKNIQEIIFALPRSQASELDRLLSQVHEDTIDIRVIPDLNEYVRLGCQIEDFDGIPMVSVNDSPLDGWGSGLKRITDIVLSALGLLLLSPLLLLLAIAVKLSSPGPIFYRQERMGLDGETFGMLKFRSMRTDAEKESGPVWAKAADDRRTWLGSLLRSTSLDELPQLWNVLKGDMSLVGPRPERPFFVNKFRTEIPGYMLRHKVKAGITGWAQVNGWRGDTSLTRRIECDLFYIRHWSYWLDWKILWLTLWRGFIHRNAY